MGRERGWRVTGIAVLLVMLGMAAPACSGAQPSKAPPSPAVTVSSSPTASPQATPSSEATPPDAFSVAQFDVAQPQGFVAAFGSMWVPAHHDGTITRIDAQTNKVVAVIQGVGYQAQDVTAGAGSVWVPASGADYMARIDPATNKVISKLKIGPVSDVRFGFGGVWAATKNMQLLRVDPKSERVVARLQVGPKGPNDCNNGPVITARWVWINVCDTGMLMQVDPKTNRIVRRINLSAEFRTPNGSDVIASAAALWASFDGAVARLDPDTGKVIAQSPIDHERSGVMAVDHGTLWMGGRGVLTAFDVETLKILATYQVTGPGGEVQPAVGFGSVWVQVYVLSQVTRFDFPAAA